MHLTNLLKGYAEGIHTCHDLVTVFTGFVLAVTEAEPIHCIIQFVTRRRAQLLHIVQHMFPKDNAFHDTGFEEELAMEIRNFRRNQATIFVEQSKGCTAQRITGFCRCLEQLNLKVLGRNIDFRMDLFHTLVLHALTPKGNIGRVAVPDCTGHMLRHNQRCIIVENIHHRLRMQDHNVQHMHLIAIGILLVSCAVICNRVIFSLLQSRPVSFCIFCGDHQRATDKSQGFGHLVMDIQWRTIRQCNLCFVDRDCIVRRVTIKIMSQTLFKEIGDGYCCIIIGNTDGIITIRHIIQLRTIIHTIPEGAVILDDG